jgi:hypothetical protein
MDHFAGLDVSVKETGVCIVDDTGRIVREVKVGSEPEALLKVLDCRNGCSVLWPKQGYQWSASRRGICERADPA